MTGTCSILGILRLKGEAKIPFSTLLKGVEAVRFRGGKLGVGFASVNLEGSELLRVKAFADGPETLERIKSSLASSGGELVREEPSPAGRPFLLWTGYFRCGDYDGFFRSILDLNSKLSEGGFRGRIFQSSRHIDLYKEVGASPREVADHFGLDGREADLWLAQTGLPASFPSSLPIWPSPFSSSEWVVAHDGEVSSFGANVEYLKEKGWKGFVGADSEVIAFLLDELTRVEGLGMEDAAKLLNRPYGRKPWSKNWSTEELFRFRGASLDGSYSIVTGYSDGEDVYMLVLVDRARFRPMVIGIDDGHVYAASEECEIRAISPNARVYTLEPGRYMLASMNRGIVEYGRSGLSCWFTDLGPFGEPQATGEAKVIDASAMDSLTLYQEVSSAIRSGHKELVLKHVNGQRYIGIGAPEGVRLSVYGTPGNCLGNLNSGAEIHVYGNAGDLVGDAMHAGRIVIHGDARDVVGQALQGGEIFVRGNVGNRGAIQMREYGTKRPYLIVGNVADDYFGEYMAGGIAIVLGLDCLLKGCDRQLVGDYLATGMVGGRIYVRGKVRPQSVGLRPLDEFGVAHEWKSAKVEYRRLNDEDLKLIGDKVLSFFKEFELDLELYNKVMDSFFTVVTVK